jgi:hypothetical protein
LAPFWKQWLAAKTYVRAGGAALAACHQGYAKPA